MSDEAFLSYRFGGQICNERLETRLREALCGEQASCSGAPAAGVDQGSGPRGLRLEAGYGVVGNVVWNTPALEIVGDQQITCTPAGEERRPARSEAAIVDQPGTLNGLERLPSLGTSRAPVRETLLEGSCRVVACPERAQCLTLRLETP